MQKHRPPCVCPRDTNCSVIEIVWAESGTAFFTSQPFTGIAVDSETEKVVGIYILHPNNVGRYSHISNASYTVKKDFRGKHIGELLVKDCIAKAHELGFKYTLINCKEINLISVYLSSFLIFISLYYMKLKTRKRF